EQGDSCVDAPRKRRGRPPKHPKPQTIDTNQNPKQDEQQQLPLSHNTSSPQPQPQILSSSPSTPSCDSANETELLQLVMAELNSLRQEVHTMKQRQLLTPEPPRDDSPVQEPQIQPEQLRRIESLLGLDNITEDEDWVTLAQQQAPSHEDQ